MASTLRRWATAGVTAACLGGCSGYVLGVSPSRLWQRGPFASAPVAAGSHGDATMERTPAPTSTVGRPADLENVAQQMGQDLIISVFRDEETLGDLVKLLVRTFKDDRVKTQLTAFFKEQFTQDEQTVAALKKFLVTDVLGDAWVRDELLAFTAELGGGIANDEAVWPNQTLQTLGDASLEALQTEEFQRRATAA
eukprot:CAMPEP_0174855560 /NCGR_PEP_ID=MMETSP1114-20130205/33551_1 /TAXON_ID=312471 /ORGANISM="Neobodo designis, Strain CCAP 1951/1" /LENGTH=194 /DNA_ID=CAMNT_0016090301 /DNA_START=48 /DNA_END=628 /DNA_ORIENTATION=-